MQNSIADSQVLQQFFNKYGLTQRESEILSLIVTHGYTNKEIAENCCISEKTVKIHLANIMNKIGIGSMRRLLALLLRQALMVSALKNEKNIVTSMAIN
ncbi:helix-turn-helix transcriptional regulator [Paenibacillus sp. GCM10023248]|uniref:helix-turn-helix domain-containing protein n=1 Tax=Bacillales TaxID=1385 RepID=UPI0023783126|nr:MULTISPECIES: helix-turn-helix transcriptional regulator [Bacillales]MDD9266550.1 helix-turn-helix transcriptional regulator [Paenibacillus sp. MAHUQ-63]MDR6878679.1 DNA-binding CsgD family transcriptional regulator [Bacillus sp. 3255]